MLRLSPEARAGYDRWCREHNLTLTALLEAIGLLVAEGKTLSKSRIVKRAHEIDVERNSRRP